MRALGVHDATNTNAIEAAGRAAQLYRDLWPRGVQRHLLDASASGPGSEACTTPLQAIERISPVFAALLSDTSVAPDALRRVQLPTANLTFLIPPTPFLEAVHSALTTASISGDSVNYDVVSTHILSGGYRVDSMPASAPIPTLNDQFDILFDGSSRVVMSQAEANMTRSDLDACAPASVIHFIDSPLMPPQALVRQSLQSSSSSSAPLTPDPAAQPGLAGAPLPGASGPVAGAEAIAECSVDTCDRPDNICESAGDDLDERALDAGLYVTQRCRTVHDALRAWAPELATLVIEALPDGAPFEDVMLLHDPCAALTMLLPPREAANGLLYGFRSALLHATEIWSILSLHIIPVSLTSDDLADLEMQQIATLNPSGQTVEVSVLERNLDVRAGATAVVGGADINACAIDSTLHNITDLMLPMDFVLPADAGPWPPGQPRDLPRAPVFSGSSGAAPAVEQQPQESSVLDAATEQSDTSATAIIAGICGAAVLVIVLACCAFCLVRRRHRLCRCACPAPPAAAVKSHAQAASVGTSPLAKRSAECQQGEGAFLRPPDLLFPVPLQVHAPSDKNTAGSMTRPKSAPTQVPSANSPHTTCSMAAYTLPIETTFTSSPASGRGASKTPAHGPIAMAVSQARSPGMLKGRGAVTLSAPEDRRKLWVQQQLEGLEGAALVQRFVVLGASERRTGGQAVVQFARALKGNHQYALKFFLSQEWFEVERHICTKSPLKKLLPRLEGLYDNADGSVRDSRGHPLPPFIVTERGQSLEEWTQRHRPGVSTALPVVASIAQRLEAMHDAGYAHRDLKPSNIIWLPRGQEWALVDFGCAAAIGTGAPLSFTLKYATPEVVRAWLAHQPQLEVSAAADAWALGVIAFEMLTGVQAFDMRQGQDMVVAQLLDGQRLPWRALPEEHMTRLGVLRGPVLALLQCDVARRTSIADLNRQLSVMLLRSNSLRRRPSGNR